MIRRHALGAALLSLALAACNVPGYVILPGDLDGGGRLHRSERVSETLSAPTEAQKDRPVVIAAHGFTATTYEMSALADHLRQEGMLVSNLLLGGHGENIAAFAASDWAQWGAPIADEYRRLQELGYRDIAVVAASTGGSLTLEYLASGQLAPSRLVLVAPLLHFRDWRTGFIGLFEWLGVQAVQADLGQQAVGNWYRNRPTGQVRSLVELTDRLKGHLAEGITLPASSRALLIQSREDPTVDPRSAEAIQAGLQGDVRLQWVDSRQHVPIWPAHTHRPWSEAEVALQRTLLGDIARFIRE